MDRGNASSALAQLQRGGLAFSLSAALATLRYYEAFTGLAFPLPKLDLVYLPVFPVGAMEQWGLVTYTESYLASNSSSAAGVVAHELAHQWFGNLVTAAWWDALWLQEGFATFLPFLSLTATLPQLAYLSGWRAATSGALAEDAFANSQALTCAKLPDSAGAAYATFNTISYDKGAAVIARLQARVEGARTGSFAAGLSAYLRAHAHGSAVPADLFTALSAASGVATLAAEFQTAAFSAGAPLVTAAWAAPGTLVLTQSRFFASAASAASAGAVPLWTVPLTITAANPSPALSAALALQPPAGFGGVTLALLPFSIERDGWLLLANGSAAEYSRSLLTPDMYEALARALENSGGGGAAALPPVDARAQLLDDVFALAEARVAPAIVNMSFALAYAARWVGTEANSSSVRSVLSTRLARLRVLLTDDVAAGDIGNAAVAPRAVTPGTDEFACLQALFSFAASRLGMSPQSGAVNRTALKQSLLVPYDASNVNALISSVAANPGARDIAWAFLRDNWSGVTRFLGYRSTLASLVRSATRSFVSAPLAADIAAFFTPTLVAATPVVTGTWERALENIEAARTWVAADAAATCAFLRSAAPSAISEEAAASSTRTPWASENALALER
jgi:hypothetical protein